VIWPMLSILKADIGDIDTQKILTDIETDTDNKVLNHDIGQ